MTRPPHAAIEIITAGFVILNIALVAGCSTFVSKTKRLAPVIVEELVKERAEKEAAEQAERERRDAEIVWTYNNHNYPIATDKVRAQAKEVKTVNNRTLWFVDASQKQYHFMTWPGRSDMFWMKNPRGWNSSTLYKETSDHGSLAVLVASRYVWEAHRAELRKDDRVIDSASMLAPYHDGRVAFRFKQKGRAYPAGSDLRVVMVNGSWIEWRLTKTEERINNLGEPDRTSE